MYPQTQASSSPMIANVGTPRNESIASILAGTSEHLGRAESLADQIEQSLGISCPRPEIPKSPSNNVSEHAMTNRNAVIRLGEALDRIKASLV